MSPLTTVFTFGVKGKWEMLKFALLSPVVYTYSHSLIWRFLLKFGLEYCLPVVGSQPSLGNFPASYLGLFVE